MIVETARSQFKGRRTCITTTVLFICLQPLPISFRSVLTEMRLYSPKTVISLRSDQCNRLCRPFRFLPLASNCTLFLHQYTAASHECTVLGATLSSFLSSPCTTAFFVQTWRFLQNIGNYRDHFLFKQFNFLKAFDFESYLYLFTLYPYTSSSPTITYTPAFSAPQRIRNPHTDAPIVTAVHPRRMGITMNQNRFDTYADEKQKKTNLSD